MGAKLKILREQVATYLRNAEMANDELEAERFILLAAWCQEQILELERQADLDRHGGAGRRPLLIAAQTTRLLRDLAEVKKRLELIETVIHWSLPDQPPTI